MSLTPRQYRRFLYGREGESAIVARLPGDLAARMPTLSMNVRLGREYALKLGEKHQLRFSALGIIQEAIDRGYCTQSRPAALDFLYVNDDGGTKRFVLGIKAAANGQETWLTTLYRCNEDELRRRLRKANLANKLIRAHEWT